MRICIIDFIIALVGRCIFLLPVTRQHNLESGAHILFPNSENMIQFGTLLALPLFSSKIWQPYVAAFGGVYTKSFR
jgi:hypothetical protein